MGLRTLPISMLLLASLPAVALPGETIDPDRVRRLVEDLGHERWERREAAEAALAELGPVAVPSLEAAARSGDPERALRARGLLARLDPPVGLFDVACFTLTPSPLLVASARVTGPPGRRLTARLVTTGTPTLVPPASSFSVVWNDAGDGKISVEVRTTSARTGAVPGPSTLRSPGVRRVDEGDIASYVRCDGLRERRLARFVTLLVQRRTRRSHSSGAGQPAPSAVALLEELSSILRDQAAAGDPRSREEAVTIIGLLELEPALPDLRETRATGSLRDAATLARARLGDTDAEAELRERLPHLPTKLAVPAARWLGAEDPAAVVEPLIGALDSPDPLEIHLALASLADTWPGLARAAGTAAGDARDAVRRAILSEAFLAEAPWEDPELEHLLARILESLEPGRSEHRELARTVRRSLDAFVSGGSPLRRVPLVTLWPLWRDATLRSSVGAPRPSERKLLAAIATGSEDRSLLREALGDLVATSGGEPLDSDSFEALVSGHRRLLEGRDPLASASPVTAETYLRSDVRSLLSRSSRMALGRGQLAPWVRLLDAWHRRVAAPSSGPLPGTVPGNAGAVPRQRIPSRGATIGRQAVATQVWRRSVAAQLQAELNRLTGLSSPLLPPRAPADATTPGPHVAWLSDAGAVAERERAFAALRSSSGGGPPLVLHRYELRLPAESGTSGADPGTGGGVRVIHAIRRVVIPGRSVRWESACGAHVAFPLERLVQASGERYRVEGGRIVKIGLPVLIPSRIRREVRHLTSRIQPRGQRLGATGMRRDRAVLLLSRSASAARSSSGQGRSLPPLDWDAFIRVHCVEPSGDAPWTEAAALLDVLCQLARAEGVEGMLRLLDREVPSLERPSRDARALQGIDRYLAVARPAPRLRWRILERVMASIEEARLQPVIFRILQRTTDSDFGYRASTSLPSAARSSARRRSVQRARDWWTAERPPDMEGRPPRRR